MAPSPTIVRWSAGEVHPPRVHRPDRLRLLRAGAGGGLLSGGDARAGQGRHLASPRRLEERDDPVSARVRAVRFPPRRRGAALPARLPRAGSARLLVVRLHLAHRGCRRHGRRRARRRAHRLLQGPHRRRRRREEAHRRRRARVDRGARRAGRPRAAGSSPRTCTTPSRPRSRSSWSAGPSAGRAAAARCGCSCWPAPTARCAASSTSSPDPPAADRRLAAQRVSRRRERVRPASRRGRRGCAPPAWRGRAPRRPGPPESPPCLRSPRR